MKSNYAVGKHIFVFCLLPLILVAPSVMAERYSTSNIASLVDKLYANDLSYLQAKNAVIGSKFRDRGSLAGLLPRVTLDVSGRKVDRDRPNSLFYQDRSAEIRITQPLFRMSAWKQLGNTELEQSLAEARLLQEEQAMLFRFVQKSVELLRAEDQLLSFREQEALLDKRLEKVTEEIQQGIVAGKDKVKVNADYLIIKAKRVKQETEKLVAVFELEKLTRSRLDMAPLKTDISLNLPKPENVDWWQNEALNNNMELLVSRKEVAVAGQKVSSYQADYYPTVDAYLAHKYYDTDVAEDLQVTQENIFGLQVSVALYEGGSTSARVNEAENALHQSMRAQEDSFYQMHSQIRTLWMQLQSALQLLDAQSHAVDAAHSALDVEVFGSSLGSVSTFQVLEVEREYFQAQRDLVALRYDFILNLFTLYQVSGKLNKRLVVEHFQNWLMSS